MKENAGFTFTGIGTSWCILTDGEPLSAGTQERILNYVQIFNKRFSRFLSDSEASAFRDVAAGEYSISEEFAILLSRADELRRLTKGLYDPAVGGLLEKAGYDAAHRMTPQPGIEQFVLPKWTLAGRTLMIDRPVSFDLGGIGKGYCIDRVAEVLESCGHRHYLVDGGGDMYGTTRRDGEPWNIALEYPGRPDMAAGTIELANGGVAVSDSFRRRWGAWHHIVHPVLRTPVEHVAGVAAVAPNAWAADCVTSALFFADEPQRSAIAASFKSRFLVFRGDGTTHVSADWNGELFL